MHCIGGHFQMLYAHTCSQTKDHGDWPGSETSAHVKSRVDQHSVLLAWSLPVVVAKVYAMHII